MGVRDVGSAKTCGVCGDEMDCHDYGGGSVWSCTTHGVRDWHFGGEAHWAPALPGTVQGRAPRAPRGPT